MCSGRGTAGIIERMIFFSNATFSYASNKDIIFPYRCAILCIFKKSYFKGDKDVIRKYG